MKILFKLSNKKKNKKNLFFKTKKIVKFKFKIKKY